MVLDDIFRSNGCVQYVRACLATCHPEEVLHLFGQGLAEDTVVAITDLLKGGLDLDWSMRTTVSVNFSKGDGRKLVSASSKQSHSPDNKRCDRMYAALGAWVQNASTMAQCMLAIQVAIRAVDADATLAKKKRGFALCLRAHARHPSVRSPWSPWGESGAARRREGRVLRSQVPVRRLLLADHVCHVHECQTHLRRTGCTWAC